MKGRSRPASETAVEIEVSEPAAAWRDNWLVLGPIAVDTVTDRLLVAGQERQVAPSPLRILKYLLVRSGRAVGRREIEREVLRSNHQNHSSSVRNHIAELRLALGPFASVARAGPEGWRLLVDSAAIFKK